MIAHHLVHGAAGAAGVLILATVAHTAIVAGGGYSAPSAPLTIALAVGLAIGAIAVGVAWRDGRRALCCALVLALGAGEAWMLVNTAERVVDRREAAQAPIRAVESARDKASARFAAAEAAANVGETARLRAALDAKSKADAAAIEKAAERGCAANCRALLQAQVDAADREVAAARKEIETARVAAAGELASARAALSAIEPPKSATPLADRLGVAGWAFDLAVAAIASIAANGLGAFLLAFASHAGGRRIVPQVNDVTPIVIERHIDIQPVRNPGMEADAFARAAFRPAAGHVIELRDIRRAYRDWSQANGREPLPDADIGRALSSLFERVGLTLAADGTRAVVGIEWSPAFLNAGADEVTCLPRSERKGESHGLELQRIPADRILVSPPRKPLEWRVFRSPLGCAICLLAGRTTRSSGVVGTRAAAQLRGQRVEHKADPLAGPQFAMAHQPDRNRDTG